MHEHSNTSTLHEDRFTRLCRNIDRQLREDPGCANRGAEIRVARAETKPINRTLKKRTAHKKPSRAARGKARRTTQTATTSGGDDSGGGGDPEPAGDSIDDDEHTYTRRGNSYSDQHSFNIYDPSDPTPRIPCTLWPTIPDPVSYYGVCESSWGRLAALASGRAREVCRMLGEGEADFKKIGKALKCSDRTARDDARKLFQDVVSGRAGRQFDLFDRHDVQYIPKRSPRGRKKKAQEQAQKVHAGDEGGAE